MPAPATANDFLDHLRVSGLLKQPRLDEYLEGLQAEGNLPQQPRNLATRFVRDGVLTQFQAQQLLQGRHKNFVVGRYKILQPLGAGGMSKVYLCEHSDMGHRVAMKVLSKQSGKDKSLVARFIREARVAAALNHPNVVRAHDIDSTGGTIHYIIMDFVDGVSLNGLVRQRGKLKPAHAAHYVAQAACGLQHIHEAGLLHRDIKPGNLLVDRDGVVKILDLGLARLQEDEERLTAKYNDGAILGTADFIAPEQSLVNTEVDHRADIYGLGCTFYFMLTGNVPFPGNIAKKLIGHQTKEPEPVSMLAPETPPELERVVKRMMAKKPKDRYQSAAAVLRDLAKWLEVEVPPPSESELPRLGLAAQGSSHGGRSGMMKSYLSAAQATLGNLESVTRTMRPPKAPKRGGWLARLKARIASMFSRR
jgi:serine/threonine protein kinase